MEGNIIQINSGIMINVHVSVKTSCMSKMQTTKLSQTMTETKTIPTIFNEKNM